ncbi:MAG: CoA transferase [Polyangiales bacterium]
MSTPPLAGIRVLDFTQNLPGPYATMVLASLGAEVIKVEPPKGDTGRFAGRLFELVNGGKKSVVVDLKDPADREALRKLLPTVDVVVEGFRPGVLAELGFGAEQLLREHPSLVYCSISAYGQSGPYRDRPGHDLNLQALVGACDIGRDAEDVPHGSALPIADLSSSMTAATSILAALFARTKDGKGRFVDVALTDTVLSWSYVWGEGLIPADLELDKQLPKLEKLVRGKGVPTGMRETLVEALRSPKAGPLAAKVGKAVRGSKLFGKIERLRLHLLPHYDLFRTRDGKYLAVGIVDEDKFWSALARQVGLGDLGKIPLPGRFVLGPQLRALLSTALLRKTRDEWLRTLDLEAVPVSPVLTITEALEDPQLASRRPAGATAAVPAPLASSVDTRPPRLGEHTDALLGAHRAHA